MVPIEPKLERLDQLSKQLNAESDALNGLIEMLDARLAEMNIGVSVWDGPGLIDDVDGYVLDKVAESTTRADEQGDEDDRGFWWKTYRGWRLGYTRLLEGGWGLAVEPIELTETYEGERWVGDDETPRGDHVRLTQAPRSVRIAAAPRIEPFVEALGLRVAEYVEAVRKARGAVEDDDREPLVVEGTDIEGDEYVDVDFELTERVGPDVAE